MSEAVPPSTPACREADFYPSLKNPAVALSAEIWQKIHAATLERTSSAYTAERSANTAFRLSLPPLSGYQNICDFIACVGYGILLGAIKDTSSSKLLYAAQLALATIPRESKTQSRTDLPDAKHPTPPPLLPQPTRKKGITRKKVPFGVDLPLNPANP